MIKFEEQEFYKNLKKMNSQIPLRIGILGSTKGSSLQPIIDAIENKELRAEIAIVLSNRLHSGILERASKHHIKNVYISTNKDGKKKNRFNFDSEITQIFQEHNVDYILMIGYMRIVSKEFCQTWKYRCLNIHPSLLPDFANGMDIEVHESVLKSGKTYTGCTVHFVTEEVDGGPIVYQSKCEVKTDDTPESLKKRVQSLEGPAFICVLHQLINKK